MVWHCQPGAAFSVLGRRDARRPTGSPQRVRPVADKMPGYYRPSRSRLPAPPRLPPAPASLLDRAENTG